MFVLFNGIKQHFDFDCLAISTKTERIDNKVSGKATVIQMLNQTIENRIKTKVAELGSYIQLFPI